MNFVITDDADCDIRQLSRYLEERAGHRTAVKFIDSLQSTIELILQFPQIGALHETKEKRLAGSRYMRLKKFPKVVVAYRVLDQHIEILNVYHGSRNRG